MSDESVIVRRATSARARRIALVAAITAVCAASLSCSQQEKDPATSTAADQVVQIAMRDLVAPQAQIIWDLGNKAVAIEGPASATALSAQDWKALATAAKSLEKQATTLAKARNLQAALPGAKLDGEENVGTYDAARVQALLDSNPDGFKTSALGLAAQAAETRAAVERRDPSALADAAGELEEICESCHRAYWYPEEAARQ